jgi:phosphoribosylformylglycinamidine cyclo-ligase
MGLDYKKAGVDVETGDAFVDWIQKSQKSKGPFAEHIVSGVGGFASIFRLGFPEIKNPCLVSSTDGVGTKVKIASHYQKFETIGQDLVAMCVNDLICCGARPLFFLDYYASGKLNLEHAQSFLESVRRACHTSGCALVGGETAEMPGVYHGDDFDCAGFAVGLVDESQVLGAHRVRLGAQVVGISSSGFHSNGYSLLRKVFEMDMDQWQQKLLEPTHLYAPLLLPLLASQKIQALAHITGGGMENIPRVLPPGTCLRLLDWAWPPEFLEVQDRSGLSRIEMLKTLNCGIGMAAVVEPDFVAPLEKACEQSGYKTYLLGEVESCDPSLAPNSEPQVIY